MIYKIPAHVIDQSFSDVEYAHGSLRSQLKLRRRLPTLHKQGILTVPTGLMEDPEWVQDVATLKKALKYISDLYDSMRIVFPEGECVNGCQPTDGQVLKDFVKRVDIVLAVLCATGLAECKRGASALEGLSCDITLYLHMIDSSISSKASGNPIICIKRNV